MKFITIRLQNVFAYDGTAEFDLAGTSPQKNIVLIWGRNGMGKTSFLNAVRLLFTGMEKSETRRVGFPPVQLTVKQYLLGDGARWTGVINRSARRRASNAGMILDAKIEISWLDTSDRQYTATRWWTVENDNVNAGIYIDGNGQRLAAGPAEEFLAETLPPDFVKFFFFDGEEIKSIAESSGSLQSELDRLLQITFVEEVAEELEKLAGERRRRGMRVELRKQLDDVTSAHARAITAGVEAEEKLAELDAQLDADGLELRRLELRRSNLSSGASELQRDALEKQRKRLSEEFETVTEQLVADLPLTIPMMANLRLMKQAQDQIEIRLAAGGSAESHFVLSVKGEIPTWLREAEPVLSDESVARIATHLAQRLEGALSVVQPSGTFAQADLLRVERVRRVMEYWNVILPERREQQARLLARASQLKIEMQDVVEALLHLEVGAQGNIDEYRKVVNRIEELKTAEALQNQQKGVLSDRLVSARKQQLELAEKIRNLEASQDQASMDAKDGQYVIKVARALNDIALAVKKATREELEIMLNERFSRIITHQLIGHIAIDDTYVMTFTEKSGRVIGRTSLSSGMKQLAATALLWALKDSAGQDMPVIIDTPLGRIDRENQDHLLLAYYPELSHQVIILPTNAEIDSRKRALLEPRISRHYTIENVSGDAATISTHPLVELV